MSVSIRPAGDLGTAAGAAAVEQFRASLRGALVTPASPGYDAARAIWNAMIDRRPALIVQCAGAADVRRAVRFAREHGLPLAVRGGGHNIAGNALCDDGMVVDLSGMRGIRVDPVRRTASVAAGARLGDVDHETQAFGLAVPLGINSTTGIAGLTLGGGFGWLSRRYGMTVDNLLGADVVLANGDLVHAGELDHADLFWAIRGGGGNFGIVTSFDFRLHQVGPDLLAGLVIHPLDAAGEVLRFYRDFITTTRDELVCWFVLRKAPPLPFLAPEWHGREILALAICYAGRIEDGLKAADPLRRFGKPIADIVAPMPYTAWQQVLDPLLTPGQRNYWKSHDFALLPDGLIDVFLDFASRLPDPQTEIAFAQLGGAVSRVPSHATAYAHRGATWVLNVHGRWSERGKDEACIAWARDLANAAAPFATGGVYVNFLTQEEGARIPAAYGPNLERLRVVKHRYDPTNLFRVNQNITPA